MANNITLDDLLNNLKGQFVIGVPYWYPVCPLHPAHGRIYVIADVLAKYIESFNPKTKGNTRVFVPIGSHYSGSTAVEWAGLIARSYKGESDEKINRILGLMRRYSVEDNVLLSFKDPRNILDYFSSKIIENLRDMNVFVDERAYNTLGSEYVLFVELVFNTLQNNGFLVNRGDSLTINYEKAIPLAREQEQKTGIITRSHLNLLKEGLEANIKNFRNREEFFIPIHQPISSNNYTTLSVPYKGIPLDPMHDSLLYDVYNSLRFGFNLPVNIFLAEEHLKTWLARRLIAESIYLDEEKRTLSYFILGNGKLDGKHMSSSSGNAIFVQDLCRDYGYIETRMFLLLLGDPRNDFNIVNEGFLSIIKGVRRGVNSFMMFLSRYQNKTTLDDNDFIIAVKTKIEKNGEILRRYLNSGELNKAAEYFLFKLPRELDQFEFRTKELDNFLSDITYVFFGKRGI